MAKKFVRTITDTKLKGKDIEPLITNKQNDLLSDEHDVYVRNKDYYHCLTNAIQKIESKNESIVVSKKDKNTVVLEYTGDGGGTGEVIPVKLESLSKYIDVEKIEENHFQLSTEQLEIELEEIRKLIENMGQPEDDFLGDYNEYDFRPITGNNRVVEREIPLSANIELSPKNDVGKYKIIIPLNYAANYTRLAFENFPDIEHTAKKNYELEFVNSSERNVSLNILATNLGGRPRTEEDFEYKDGDIVIKGNSKTKVKFTFYTDPDAKVLRSYIKEIK